MYTNERVWMHQSIFIKAINYCHSTQAIMGNRSSTVSGTDWSTHSRLDRIVLSVVLQSNPI